MLLIRRIIISLLLLKTTFVQAGIDGLTVSGGTWDNKRNGYRLASVWLWDQSLYANEIVDLRGLWEASLGYWRAQKIKSGENKEVWILGASPVFQLRYAGDIFGMVPYLEAGIGAAAMSEDSLGDRELGSTWHFEDRIGFGFSKPGKRTLEIAYRYFHYSNAGIERPNDGLDMHTLNVTLFF